MSPTHGEAARIASDLLESADLIPWAHTFRTLLEEHGEMAAMLEDSLSGLEYIARRYGPLDGVGWDRINAYRAKLAGEGGEGEPEAEPRCTRYRPHRAGAAGIGKECGDCGCPGVFVPILEDTQEPAHE